MPAPKVKFPEPTPEETALQSEQLQLLQQQRDILARQAQQQNLLAPYLLEDLGLTPQTDAAGNITGYTERPKTEAETLQEQVEAKLLDRSQKALRGELPIDPALERSLTDQSTQLREALRQQLGPGYATSTPGMTSLADQAQQATAIRDAARRGELSLAEGLGLTMQETQARNMDRMFTTLGNAAQMQQLTPQLLGQVASIATGPQQLLLANRAGQFAGNQAHNAAKQQWWGQIGSTIGGVVGGIAGGPGGGALGSMAGRNIGSGTAMFF